MNALNDAAKDRKITYSEEAKKSVLKTLAELHSHTAFLSGLIEGHGGINKSDLETYLTLFRHHFDDIAKCSSLGDVLSEELSEANAMLRKANSEIAAMRKELGDKITARAVSSGIKKFESLFGTWYGMCGFKYMSIKFAEYGIIADASCDVMYHESEGGKGPRFEYMVDKALAPLLLDKIPYAFSGWDIMREYPTGGALLDTEKNRAALISLFSGAFPGSHIRSFSSHSDRELYTMRFEVYVPYEDIESLFAKLLGSGGAEDAGKPEGDGEDGKCSTGS